MAIIRLKMKMDVSRFCRHCTEIRDFIHTSFSKPLELFNHDQIHTIEVRKLLAKILFEEYIRIYFDRIARFPNDQFYGKGISFKERWFLRVLIISNIYYFWRINDNWSFDIAKVIKNVANPMNCFSKVGFILVDKEGDVP